MARNLKVMATRGFYLRVVLTHKTHKLRCNHVQTYVQFTMLRRHTAAVSWKDLDVESH